MADFGKINLAALPSHKIASFAQAGSKETIECIVIPIKKNHLYKSEKGNVYLDIVAFKLKEPMKDDDGAVQQTHLVKQSLPKEVRASMSEDDKKNQPIIGNLNIYDGGGSGYQEREAVQDTSFGAPADGGDLPF